MLLELTDELLLRCLAGAGNAGLCASAVACRRMATLKVPAPSRQGAPLRDPRSTVTPTPAAPGARRRRSKHRRALRGACRAARGRV